jgi:hypothetical protein
LGAGLDGVWWLTSTKQVSTSRRREVQFDPEAGRPVAAACVSSRTGRRAAIDYPGSMSRVQLYSSSRGAFRSHDARLAVIAIALCAWTATGCGTYSLLRSADTLKKGQFEVSVAATGNTLPELLGAVQVAAGVTDWLELGAQYEVYSALAQARFGVLSSEKHGVALALAVGGGASSLWTSALSDPHHEFSPTATAGFTIGRRWDFFELYLGEKCLFLTPEKYFINTGKLGVRFTVWKHLLLGAEAGVTLHHDFLVLGEGALQLGVKWSL